MARPYPSREPAQPAGRVVVIGAIHTDLVATVPELPRPGETVTGGQFARHGGGKGANQAIAAARLGARVALVGAVGDDDIGAAAVEELAAEGVDVSGIAREPGVSTGVALIFVDQAGENCIAVAGGASAQLSGEHVAAALDGRLDGGAGVVLLSQEVPAAAVEAGVRAAHAAGWTAVLNPAPARELPDDLLGLAPVLTPNASEAEALTGESDPESAAAALAARTGAPVVVTLGSAGALLLADGRAQRIPAPRVEVVDTTGAGDTLNGALAAELARGEALEDALRTAIEAAARSTQAAGARGGMPHRDELGGSP